MNYLETLKFSIIAITCIYWAAIIMITAVAACAVVIAITEGDDDV